MTLCGARDLAGLSLFSSSRRDNARLTSDFSSSLFQGFDKKSNAPSRTASRAFSIVPKPVSSIVSTPRGLAILRRSRPSWSASRFMSESIKSNGLVFNRSMASSGRVALNTSIPLGVSVCWSRISSKSHVSPLSSTTSTRAMTPPNVFLYFAIEL